MKCPKCGYENKDNALCCSLCGKVFRKEKTEKEKKEEEKSFKSPKEPETNTDFLDHDGPIDYRDVIYSFKKLRKRILHPIEVCLFAVFCGGFFQMISCFLDEWGIIPGLKTRNRISFFLSFIISVIIISVFFMKKTTKNILMVCGFSILAIIIAVGSRIFDIMIGWKGVPQLPTPSLLIIFLLIIFIGTIIYRFVKRRRK